jgi:hypothetical protein
LRYIKFAASPITDAKTAPHRHRTQTGEFQVPLDSGNLKEEEMMELTFYFSNGIIKKIEILCAD